MSRQVLFIQGGGNEGHKFDAPLVASLTAVLGNNYTVHYPALRTDETVPDFGWLQQIGKQISDIGNNAFLVAHSLGASMLLKYLSENKMKENISGIFLISTPFWSGHEDWVKGLKVEENFADRISKSVPIFLYHCHDDEETPFSHLDLYKQKLTWATVREIVSGGHQLSNDLNVVATDIKSL